MTEAFKKVGQMTLSGSGTQNTLYTVPGAKEAAVKHIRLVNFSGASVNVKLWHDGTANQNLILPSVALGAGEWAEFDGSLLMETGDTLMAEANAANAIAAVVYGVEFS